MRIERRSLLVGCRARGVVVVIDVLRAFSCSALMFHYGIRDLALVRTPQEALAFRDWRSRLSRRGRGEGREGRGFDVGNSPADIVSKGESFLRPPHRAWRGRQPARRAYWRLRRMQSKSSWAAT
jgi:2-phosphosulfolactate phosphatase